MGIGGWGLGTGETGMTRVTRKVNFTPMPHAPFPMPHSPFKP
ncbi:hypothetical protein [Nostoc sp. CMAA1605]|nr:hypothetical protein [Nostoc sp. CMAA1605]